MSERSPASLASALEGVDAAFLLWPSFTAPCGQAARSLIDERDIAAVAIRTLTGTEPERFGIPAESFNGHGGKTYVLSGPRP